MRSAPSRSYSQVASSVSDPAAGGQPGSGAVMGRPDVMTSVVATD